MKRFILSLTLLFFGTLTYAQINDQPKAADCQKFRNGSFKIVDEKTGTSFIVRNGDKQLERMENETEWATFYVKWLDDCTYTLMPDEAYHKKYPLLPANATLTVHILKTTENSYTQRSTANFADFVVESEVIKVK